MEALQETIVTSARGAQSTSLLSLVFELLPDREIPVPSNTGHIVYGAFLKLLAHRNPDLALALHSPGREKPFTLSWLYGPMIPNRGQRLLQKGQPYWFRVTGFSPEVATFLGSWIEKPPLTINLHGAEVPVVRVVCSGHLDAGSNTFRDLYDQAMDLSGKAPRSLTLRFLTPTTFRTGSHNTVFPLPGLVFYSLCQKWNTHAPVHLGDALHRLIEDTVKVSRYRLRTQMVDFGEYRQIGFMGEATFRMDQTLPDMLVRMIHLLADFAFYAGIGYKTTMGMGQVRAVGVSDSRDRNRINALQISQAAEQRREDEPVTPPDDDAAQPGAQRLPGKEQKINYPQETCSCGRTVTASLGDAFGFVFACTCGRTWRKR